MNSNWQTFLKSRSYYRILAVLSVISYVGVFSVQNYFRKTLSTDSPTVQFLLGTFPNFFGAMALFFLAFVYHQYLSKEINNRKSLIVAFLFSVLGLILWEFGQLYLGDPMDVKDIYMTFLGGITAIGITHLLVKNSN